MAETRLEDLISRQQYSRAIILGLEMLQHGTDYELIEDELCFSLTTFTLQLILTHASTGKDQADWLWQKSLSLCRWRSDVLLHGYAKFKCKINQVLQSIDLLQCRIDAPSEGLFRQTSLLPMIESLENMKALVADQWHYRMLNDLKRNTAYDQAIRRTLEVRPGAVVLDIGGGTGLLSMFAARAGARHVYCCEMSAPLAEIAQRCIHLNGYSDRVTVLQKHSTDLVVGPGGDLPCRVDVVVTELVDSGLLGEHIVSTLRHARTHLLVQNTSASEGGLGTGRGCEGGVVIPYSADVYGAAVSSHALASRQNPLHPLSPRGEGSSLSYSRDDGNRESVRECFPWSRQQHDFITSPPTAQLTVDEFYTCEDLCRLRHTRLTDVFSVGSVHFSDESPHHYSPSIAVPAIESGCIDAVAYWFDMYLLDPALCEGRRGPVVSTAPGRAGSSWDQAVVFLNQDKGRRRSVEVNQGETVMLKCEMSDDLIAIRVAAALTAADTECVLEELVNAPAAAVPVGEMDLAALNDHVVTEAYMSALHQCLTESPVVHPGAVRVLELSASWRSLLLNYIYGLETGRMGADVKVGGVVVCSSKQQECYLTKLSKALSGGGEDESGAGSGVCIQSSSLVEAFSSQSQSSAHRPHSFSQPFDLVVCELVEGSGMVRQGILADLSFALSFLCRSPSSYSHTNNNALHTNNQKSKACTSGWSDTDVSALVRRVVPYSMGVVLSLLESPFLFSQFRIDSSNTVEIEVGSVLGKYKVSVLRELDLSDSFMSPSAVLPGGQEGGTSRKFTRFLSEKKEVLQLPLVQVLTGERAEGGVSEEVDEDEDGSVIYSEVHHLVADRTGIVHCVALWYNMYMTPESCHGQPKEGETSAVFCTGPRSLSEAESCMDGCRSDWCCKNVDRIEKVPLNEAEGVQELGRGGVQDGGPESHFRQVAFLLETPRSMQRGDQLAVRVIVDKVIGIWCHII